jgi:hypothetical protein
VCGNRGTMKIIVCTVSTRQFFEKSVRDSGKSIGGTRNAAGLVESI